MRWIASAAIALALPGCFDDSCDRPVCPGDIADASPGSEWDVEHTFVLPGRELAEAQVAMKRGNLLVIGFESRPGAIDWNVHSHDGELVEAHLQGTDTALEISFAAPADGSFFPMWENAGDAAQTVSVRLRLAEGDRLVTWY